MNPESTPTRLTPGSARAINPLASLAKHPRLALVCFLAIVLLAVPVAFVKGKSKFFSTGTVQVSPRYMKNMTDDEELLFQSNTQYRQFVQQQVRTIARYDIVQKALSVPVAGPDSPPLMAQWKTPAETERQATERMQRSLMIRPVPDTYLISISLEEGKGEFLHRYLNALIDAYIQTARHEQVYGAEDRSEQLRARETKLQTELNAVLAQKSEVSQELGLSSVDTNDGNPYNKVIEQVRLQIAEAKLRAFDASAKLAAFTKQGETDIVTRSINDAVLNDPGLNSFKASINTRIAKLLTDISGLKKNHPGYIAAQREIRELNREVQVQSAEIRVEVKSALTKRYRASNEQAQALQQQLEAELDRLLEASSRYSQSFNEALNLTERVAFLRAELDKVRNRLSFFDAENESFGLVRAVSAALPADTPIGVGKKKILMLFMFAAFVIAVALPTALDLLDPKVYAPADLEKALGFGSMGWIIDRIDPDTDLFAKDQLRRLATSMIRTTDETGRNVFGLCGVKIGSGASRTTVDLAEALRLIGKRVLVVQANAYRQTADRVQSGEQALSRTLTDLLTAPSLEAALDDAVLPAEGGLLRCGSLPMERNLPNIERLEALLQKFSTRYDLVLVDAPPLLISADSELVARATQSLIVIAEAENTLKKELTQARRILERINPASVGAVLNRVSPENGFGGLNAQLQEFVTGERQSAPPLKDQIVVAAKAVIWEAMAIYAWLRWNLGPQLKAVARKKERGNSSD